MQVIQSCQRIYLDKTRHTLFVHFQVDAPGITAAKHIPGIKGNFCTGFIIRSTQKLIFNTALIVFLYKSRVGRFFGVSMYQNFHNTGNSGIAPTAGNSGRKLAARKVTLGQHRLIVGLQQMNTFIFEGFKIIGKRIFTNSFS